jgi:hypothetical protein
MAQMLTHNFRKLRIEELWIALDLLISRKIYYTIFILKYESGLIEISLKLEKMIQSWIFQVSKVPTFIFQDEYSVINLSSNQQVLCYPQFLVSKNCEIAFGTSMVN